MSETGSGFGLLLGHFLRGGGDGEETSELSLESEEEDSEELLLSSPLVDSELLVVSLPLDEEDEEEDSLSDEASLDEGALAEADSEDDFSSLRSSP